MEPQPSVPEQALVTTLRRRRAELRESMSALEQALAAPTPGEPVRWAQRVHVALVELSADLRAHIDITEGPDGLYDEVGRTTPRLAGAVERLKQEHVVLSDLLDSVLARAGAPDAAEDVEDLRDGATELLGGFVRHRQRGADLVFEAFEVDIGGET